MNWYQISKAGSTQEHAGYSFGEIVMYAAEISGLGCLLRTDTIHMDGYHRRLTSTSCVMIPGTRIEKSGMYGTLVSMEK